MESRRFVIRFGSRRNAFGFAAELRRLYDLDRWVALRVLASGDDVLVELPVPRRAADLRELIALARRHGGEPPADSADLARLREAIANAQRAEREARRPHPDDSSTGMGAGAPGAWRVHPTPDPGDVGSGGEDAAGTGDAPPTAGPGGIDGFASMPSPPAGDEHEPGADAERSGDP